MLTMKAVKTSNTFEILLLITFMGKLLGTNIYTENRSDVTFKCINIFGQKKLQWIRQVNGSILQLSKHTKINKILPKELYQRLEVKVDDESRVYILTVHNTTKADEGEYVCTKRKREKDVSYTLYIISKLYGTTIYTENMSTVTLNCSYLYKKWDLKWIRQTNGSNQLQLSKHTKIVKDLPNELNERLEVYVNSSSRVYYLIIHNATKTDEGEYLCTDNNKREGAIYARYTLYIIPSDLNINQDSSIPAVVGSSIGGLAMVIVGAVIIIAIRKTGCKLEKKPDSKTKAESDSPFYQNQEFATRENRVPKYEGLNLRADCQDQHTTYDSLKNDQSAVMHNGINNEIKMGGGKSKFNIDESHDEYVNQGGDYVDVL